MMSSHGESFDVQISGKMFSTAWESAKTKKAFNWDNKEKKHDPYQVQEFGNELENVNAKNSRQTGL